jgi:hypothetical protein
LIIIPKLNSVFRKNPTFWYTQSMITNNQPTSKPTKRTISSSLIPTQMLTTKLTNMYSTMHITTLAAILLAAPALAQPSSKQPDLLKGPQVTPETTNSLGTTNIDGYFTPVEGHPEIDAFILVTDDQDLHAQARDLENKRIFDMGMFLVDELDLLKEVTDAITSGDNDRAQTLQQQLRTLYEPDFPRDPLAEDLLALLDMTQQVEFMRILDDYWSKLIRSRIPKEQLTDELVDAMQEPMNQPNEQLRNIEQQIEDQLTYQHFLTDIRQAYEYSLRRYRNSMDAIYTAIDATEDQRAAIRELYLAHIKATRLKATMEQRQAVLLEVYKMIDEDQQQKLFLFVAQVAMDRN